MRNWLIVIAINVLLAGANAGTEASAGFSTPTPSFIELRKQFYAPQHLSSPSTNMTLLTISDRKGSEEVDGWSSALKPLYAGHFDFRGPANVAGIPGLFHARLRARFEETGEYPVMLDWSGKVCAQFGYKPGTANLLVIERDGSIRARLCGSANPAAIASFRTAVDARLSSNTAKPLNGTP